MGTTLQIICLLAGFFAYGETGSLLLPAASGVLLALAAKFFRWSSLTPSYLVLLGGLAGLHLTSGDWIAMCLVSLAIPIVSGELPPSVSSRTALWLSLVLTASGIASGQPWLFIPGLLAGLLAIRPVASALKNRWVRPSLAIAYAALILAFPTLRDGKSVYVEHGKWATDSGDYGNKDQGLRLKNETTYSYTWMVRLISDRKGEIESLSKEDSTAWIVTPTRPFTRNEVGQLTSWVRQGGRLVIVADHTDYLGHARCLNDLLAETGIDIQYGSLLPELEAEETSSGWIGETILTKTPTIVTAKGMLPLTSSKGYFEQPDYSKPGFFGPCSPSVDDKFGRHMTGGSKRLGLGTVVFWGDSTLFSNFSIFQPDSIEILSRLASPLWTTLLSLFCVAIFAICILEMPALTFVIPSIVIGSALLWAKTPKDIIGKYDSIAWSGDRKLVDDKSAPKASFSTAYAISSASGKIPRWTDTPLDERGGIWVSEEPPPSAGWKWLSPFLEVKHATKNPDNTWDELVRFVNPEATYTTSIIDKKTDQVDAGGLWTNEGVGSWWFGMGTSPARIEKILSFHEWVRSGHARWKEPPLAKPSGIARPCTAVIEGGKKLQLSLPRFEAKVGEYVYLGAGVSGLMTDVDGKTMITGSRDKDCFGYSNSPSQATWVLFYDEDMPKIKGK